MAPDASQSSRLLQANPVLFNRCTPLWFDKWPDEALAAVATVDLATLPQPQASPMKQSSFSFGTQRHACTQTACSVLCVFSYLT